MIDKTNIMWHTMSDNALAAVFGAFIKHHRLEQNKTQSAVAKEAGISRWTLVEFEKGKRSNIITLIQLLRALNLLQVMDQFRISSQMSPLKLAEMELAKRKRASRKKSPNKKTKSRRK